MHALGLLPTVALSVSLSLVLSLSVDLSAFTNKVCGSNLTLVNRNETKVMQISKARLWSGGLSARKDG